MSTRVAITGLGPVSNIGIGVGDFLDALRNGKSGTSRIKSFDTTGFPRVMAGEVEDFHPDAILHRLDPAEWGRSSQLAAAAARLAVQDAGLDPATLAAARTAAAVGTTSGEAVIDVNLARTWALDGYPATEPHDARLLPAGRLSAAVNHELGLTGEAATIATACAAANYAIGFAFDLIRQGEADIAFAGGADSVARHTHAGFLRLGALAEERCSPFDRDRAGILTAEGGAMLVLERMDHARARGARIYGEVLGYGATCDASHMVAPDRNSIARCFRLAHRNAGVRADQIDYVCAHGTGTPTNDLTEALAILEVFGDDPPPVSSIKSALGHSMGAASGFGAMACALAMTHGFLPPTINHVTPDPQLAGIDPVPNQARPADLSIVQNNGFAFGGNNAVVILGRGDA
ncbi:beta-ketoacyl-[acyl-carrier-protein] synthase family protein [Microbispora sp. NPDC088329]|uniref:beta-ketoacyl-[acyl-carrier-protein] synthase family protein n=1 Tax=Microbispora sp. NPDC088329 TaxID=3154869 RepID=UPI00343232F4